MDKSHKNNTGQKKSDTPKKSYPQLCDLYKLKKNRHKFYTQRAIRMVGTYGWEGGGSALGSQQRRLCRDDQHCSRSSSG